MTACVIGDRRVYFEIGDPSGVEKRSAALRCIAYSAVCRKIIPAPCLDPGFQRCSDEKASASSMLLSDRVARFFRRCHCQFGNIHSNNQTYCSTSASAWELEISVASHITPPQSALILMCPIAWTCPALSLAKNNTMLISETPNVNSKNQILSHGDN